MAKARPNKAQHFIPKSYLGAWCDPETPAHMTPYVWTFPKTGGPGKRRAPANLFTETDMYTIPLPDGGRDLRIEHGLGQLEKGLKQLVEDFVERRRPIPKPRFLKLIAFIAAMHGRTQTFRDHQRSQWQKTIDLGDEIMRSMEGKTAEEKMRVSQASLPPSGPTMSMEDVQRIVDMPVQMMMPAVLQAEVPILSQMVMTIYCTEATHPFITSDNPVVWFDPESYNRPPMYRGAALMYDTIEVTMPLSPTRLVKIQHDEPWSKGIKPVRYLDALGSTVNAMNRRATLYANETVVAHRDGFSDDWILRRQ